MNVKHNDKSRNYMEDKSFIEWLESQTSTEYQNQCRDTFLLFLEFLEKEEGIQNHYCIPIDWSLFDIQEASTYSGDNPDLEGTTYIHFDNSIKILIHPNRTRIRPYLETVKRWDDGSREYLESDDPKTIERYSN